MKTNLNHSRLITAQALLLLGFLVFTLPAVMSVKAGNFKYINRGEAAWLSATNNDANSNFTINALQNISILWVNGTKVIWTANSTVITGGHLIQMNGSFGGLNTTEGYFNLTSPTPRSIVLENFTAYNATSISDLFAAMHSSYAILATGDFDQFNLTGGITSDAFSITGPGFGDSVNIHSGTGNSTYNINIGAGASVSIETTNATSLGSTTNVYNIIW